MNSRIIETENFLHFFEEANDLLAITDFSGYFKHVNFAWERNLGYTKEELVLKNLKDIILFEDLDETTSSMKEVFKNGSNSIKFEIRCLSKNKKYKWLSWNGSIDRKESFIYFIIRDITDQKEREERRVIEEQKVGAELLLKKESHLFAYIEHSSTGIAMFDANLRYILANQRWRKNFLNNNASILRKSFDDFSSLSDLKIFFERALKGETFEDLEYYQENKNSSPSWYSFSLEPWYKKDKTLGGVVVKYEDISFQKIAHAAVTEKSQMLNGILRNLPIVIFKLDHKGNFTEYMGAGLKRIGHEDNELLGRNVYELFPNLKESIDKLIEGKPQVVITKGRFDKKEWYFENYMFPDNVSNTGIIGFGFDITERILKEKALEQARLIAEQGSLYKSQFLSSMSHEIRTPLNAILGFANVFPQTNLCDTQMKFLGNIITSGNTLLRLIGDILDLGKIEEGKLIIENESFNLKELLSSELHPYKHIASNKGLKFSFIFDAFIPEQVYGDVNKIRQIIVNLVGNSIKFTKKGTININVNTLSTDLDAEEAIIEFSISDTGIGIPSEIQSEIFEPFTQAGTFIRKKFGGTGLGLSIVKQLVNLLGGEISVESPSNTDSSHGGPGTKFIFTLKLKIDKERKVLNFSEKEEIIPFNGGLKVLIVEDNELNQVLASVMLEELGCESLVANNGVEALKALEKESFDVILMDVHMPVMDGYEASENIRQNLKLSIPIIGLTANVDKNDIVKCIKVGMNDYLGKPYTKLQLYTVIKDSLPLRGFGRNGK